MLFFLCLPGCPGGWARRASQQEGVAKQHRVQQPETASWSKLASRFKRFRSSRSSFDVDQAQQLVAALEDFAYLSDAVVAQRVQALLWSAWLYEKLASARGSVLDWAIAQDAYASVANMRGVPAKLHNQARQAQQRITQQLPNVGSQPQLSKALPTQQRPSVATKATGNAIWIDAGHGGEPGAVGCGGLRESDVVLDIALRVRQILTKRLRRVPVYLTRTSDKRLSLRQRVDKIDAKGGQLLVSIHANSIHGSKKQRNKVHGVETYALSFSNRGYESRLASRENAAGGSDFDLQKYLLADLATRANIPRSVALSQHVQQGVMSRLRRRWKDTRDLGVKRALLYILLARMPAVLVEVGFVSHPQESRRLRQAAYKQAIAMGIADGIVRSL
ncbi:MAG: N-acetylmuramoyl-L-alanine amidase [Myxococcota bacterium]